ncbi:DUF4190 domain-containing protein [Streptomyces sp. t39]|uniref:DUF4190 domain-containing protein n=1 Tax=Streptomyces sp. t39 TaxID=1828156 RepID=UPI00164F1B19|nr:DUF4190 domain-containing protein [Streptomyces sp. t39]
MDPAAQGGQPNPQDPYGQQPWGVPRPQPPQRRTHNGLSIASLVLGIVCCIPPLGLVLGLVALTQIRRRGQRGKGMAVAGVVLSSLSTVLLVVFMATGGAGDFWREFKKGMDEASSASSPFDLAKGDCFDIPGAEVPDETETESVPTKDCAEPHDAEVTGSYRLDEADGYPASDAADAAMEKRCNGISDAYVPDPSALPSHVANYYFLPTRESWDLGDRTVTCALAATEGRLTGSFEDGGAAEATGGGTGV